jgi:hypothetical protein
MSIPGEHSHMVGRHFYRVMADAVLMVRCPELGH